MNRTDLLALGIRAVDLNHQVALVEVQLRAADAGDLLLGGAATPKHECGVILANLHIREGAG